MADELKREILLVTSLKKFIYGIYSHDLHGYRFTVKLEKFSSNYIKVKWKLDTLLVNMGNKAS